MRDKDAEEEDRHLLDAVQVECRKRMKMEGRIYIVQTVLPNKHVYLRSTIMSPFTTTAHVNEMVQMVARIGEQVYDGLKSGETGAERPAINEASNMNVHVIIAL